MALNLPRAYLVQVLNLLRRPVSRANHLDVLDVFSAVLSMFHHRSRTLSVGLRRTKVKITCGKFRTS